jgi:hypothetical protein
MGHHHSILYCTPVSVLGRLAQQVVHWAKLWQLRTRTPLQQDNLPVVDHKFLKTITTLVETNLSSASIDLSCLYSLAATKYNMLNVVKSWKGEKDLLLKVNNIGSVTNQSYVKMLIT